MCCEDQRIQAGIGGISSLVALGATSGKLVGQMDQRHTLILCSTLTGITTYSPEGTVTAGEGIILAAAARPVILTFREHGMIVRKEWSVIHSVGSLNVLVIEGIQTDDPC